MLKLLSKRLSYTQIIVLSFVIIILLGTVLLSLPISSAAGKPTPALNCLFTATSATCVTGLVVYDTFTQWSVFGQCVILGMIQIGGLGVMTIISTFSVFLKKRIGVYERRLLMQSEGNVRLSGVVRLLKRIVIGTFLFEAAGTVLLALRFCPQMGFGEGLYNAVFHSISAFCNAGFDIMGKYGPFSSFTTYATDPLVTLTLSALIIIGGLGFMVWSELLDTRFRWHKLSLHSKLVLTISAVLLFAGTVLFLVFEDRSAFRGLPFGERLLKAFFQAVTPRTAGMNTLPTDGLTDSSNVLTIILMFIGGSPGSTAGGLKTTTIAVLVLTALSAARHDPHISIFKRRIQDEAKDTAVAILMIDIFAVLVGVTLIAAVEKVPIDDIIYEVVSAIATVGLSRGITGGLCGFSKLILIVLMFGGRVGGLSLMLSLAEKRSVAPVDRPKEKILIG